MANLIDKINEKHVRKDIPEFRVGDTVRVDVWVKEGKKERIQSFEGLVVAKKGGSVSETFTVRKISYGVGVERVFPYNSPRIVKVDVVRPGKVRRSKLYYLRDKIGKDAKVKTLVGGKIAAEIAARNARAEAAAAATEAQIKEERKEAAAEKAAEAK